VLASVLHKATSIWLKFFQQHQNAKKVDAYALDGGQMDIKRKASDDC
jgi:hypothetical protein